MRVCVSESKTKVFTCFDITSNSRELLGIDNVQSVKDDDDNALELHRTMKFSTWDIHAFNHLSDGCGCTTLKKWDFLYSGPHVVKVFSRGNPLAKYINTEVIDPFRLMTSPLVLAELNSGGQMVGTPSVGVGARASDLDRWTADVWGDREITADRSERPVERGAKTRGGSVQALTQVCTGSGRYDVLHGMDSPPLDKWIGDANASDQASLTEVNDQDMARLGSNAVTVGDGDASAVAAESGGEEVEGRSAESESEAQVTALVETPTYALEQSLLTLSKIAQEFISTEESFVASIKRLSVFLGELRFSVLDGVISFVKSAPYVGIATATEAIIICNSQFLSALQEVGERCGEINTDSIHDMLRFASDLCWGVFEVVSHFSPFFALFSQFIVHHDAFSLAYSMLSYEDPAFDAYLSTCERALGETMLSLIITPVQRLPRYVLLCKEIHRAIGKTRCRLENLEGEWYVMGRDKKQLFDLLESLDERSRAVHGSLSACAKECNNAIRAHQDNLRMHDLYRHFLEGGTDIKASEFLTRERRIVKEGSLKRHHRHGAKLIRSHEIQLFTDVLYSSSQVGKGLKLEQQISLQKDSDTLCVPIPSLSPHSESAWFVIVSSEKTLFFCGRSQVDMMSWVTAIQSCLLDNQADSDFYLMKNQIALVNTMIGEINRRLAEIGVYLPADNMSCKDGKASTANVDGSATTCCVSTLQACWWKLVDALEAVSLQDTLCELDDGPPVHNLRRVVEQHVLDVASRIALSVDCQDDSVLGNRTVMDDLLGDDKLHYLIAIGVFFEYPHRVDAAVSVDSGERPHVVKVFLLHDVLIGTILDKSKDSLKYSFHVNICDLECSGGGQAAILLVNKAARPLVRRRSLFERSNSGTIGHSSGTKILYAPTATLKAQWLDLLICAVENCRRNDGAESEGYNRAMETPELHGKEYLLAVTLQRVARDVHQPGAAAWIIEPPKADDINL